MTNQEQWIDWQRRKIEHLETVIKLAADAIERKLSQGTDLDVNLEVTLKFLRSFEE